MKTKIDSLAVCWMTLAVETVLRLAPAVLLLGVILMPSCTRRETISPDSTGEDPIAARLKDPAHPKFDFERDNNSLETLATNIKKVKLGDTPSHVIELLGPPTSDSMVAPKTPDQHWRYRILQYDVKRLRAGSNNEKYDQVIVFTFDMNNKEGLLSIRSNIPGIASSQ